MGQKFSSAEPEQDAAVTDCLYQEMEAAYLANRLAPHVQVREWLARLSRHPAALSCRVPLAEQGGVPMLGP